MKKVYIPTEQELEQLQHIKGNVYQYMTSKVIETLIMEDVLYEEIDMFDVAYDEFAEFPEILYALGKMYPEIIRYNERASKDNNLWRILTQNLPSQDTSIYYLDHLVGYHSGISDNELTDKVDLLDGSIPFDKEVIANVARILASKLTSFPKYRFDYSRSEPCFLLDSIFSCELPSRYVDVKSFEDFATIDPVYAVKLTRCEYDKKDIAQQELLFVMTRSMVKYSGRYGLDAYNNPYRGQNIISKPDAKVKKLLRHLEQHKNKYQ